MNGKVYCNGTRIKCLQQMELTVGMVGAEVEFDFSEEWDGLGKLAVFRSDGSRDVIVDENGVAVVPHEILTTPGMDVEVGVYAVREDGTTWPAPTPFCKLTRNGIAEGADPSGDESYPPTPDVGEQAVAAASKALEAAAEAQEVAADIQRRADAGEFDGAQGEKGEKGDPGEKGDKGDKGDPGTGAVELDTTLTQSGKAADAKAVGDALAGKQPKGDYVKRVNGVAPDDSGNVVVTSGADGVSATHEWNGTVLTITSASGTSSADLKGDTGAKGDKGDPGEPGASGAPGADGKTPERGVDYWTETDKAEIVAEVLAALPNAEGASF